MKKYLLPALLMAATTAFAADSQSGTGETDGYKLVWQDLFDFGTLNPDRWNIEVNGSGGGNNELQYYTDRTENVRVGDDGKGNGCLILTARREDYNNRNFTSGRVNSKTKVAFTHGKIEASIKIPVTANGLWPAFWMMGNDYDQVGWPRCGETDIMEMGHSNGINRGVSDRFFNGACHWGPAWNKTGDYAQDKTLDYSLQDGEFHLFTVIWDKNKISMYVDLDKYPGQRPYYEIDITKVNPDDEMTAGNYFHKPNFILFNLAVGGNFPGIHEASGITALNDANGQQASMYVNYVKVYQKGTSDETLETIVAGDPADGSEPPVVVGPSMADVKKVYPDAGDFYAVVLDPDLASQNKAVDLSAARAEVDLQAWEGSLTYDTPLAFDADDCKTFVSLNPNKDMNWWGGGFRTTGVDLSGLTLKHRFHCAYRTNNIAPDKMTVKILQHGDAATVIDVTRVGKDWRAIDVALGDIMTEAELRAAAVKNFDGFTVSFNGEGGRNVRLCDVFFYNPEARQNSITEVGSDTDADAPAEYFDLQGRRVANPEPGRIYIERRGTKASKVIF